MDDQVWQEWKLRLLAAAEDAAVDLPPPLFEAQVARECTDMMRKVAELHETLAARRAVALRALVADGLSLAEIAQAVGLSRQRVHQILER